MSTAIDSLEKLSEHVKNVTLPLITQHMKDEGGAIIAEQVKEAVTKRYEDMKKELTAEPVHARPRQAQHRPQVE
jgi:hypothetical protein